MTTETMTTKEVSPLLVGAVRAGKAWLPPPNPFYKRDYVISLEAGPTIVSISAPGNKIPVQDAKELIDFFSQIQKQLQRIIDAANPKPFANPVDDGN